MKKCFLILLVLLIPLFFPFQSSAHAPGQPAFFIINGKYADYHPDYTGNNQNLNVPHDIAPQTYHVNQPLTFEIDFTKFPQITPEQIKKTKFYWRYGDGELGNGTKTTHIYRQPDKYVLTILADDGTSPAPQLLESVEITVLGNETEEKQFPYAAAGGAVVIFSTMMSGGIIFLKRKHS